MDPASLGLSLFTSLLGNMGSTESEAGPTQPNFGAVGQGLTSGINSIFKNIGGGIGQRAGNAAAGLPQPGDSAAQGRKTKEFNDAAYPETNAWEQLGGSSGAGSAAQSAINSKDTAARYAHEDKQLAAQLINNKEIAQIQANTQLSINSDKYQRAGDPDSTVGSGVTQTQESTELTRQQQLKTIEQISHIRAEKNLAVQKEKTQEFYKNLNQELEKYVPQLAQYHITKQKLHSLFTGTYNILTQLGWSEEDKMLGLAGMVGGGSILAIGAGIAKHGISKAAKAAAKVARAAVVAAKKAKQNKPYNLDAAAANSARGAALLGKQIHTGFSRTQQ